MGADFSGFATKANLPCSDGRTIMSDAFKHQDGVKVPLVWMHDHDDPDLVLGHAILEARDGDMYTYCYFNENAKAQSAKRLVQHGDVESLSIYANRLKEKMVSGGKQVFHGMIKEVSLVLSGANPGALIDNVMQHSDGSWEEFQDAARIYTGLPIEHEDRDIPEPAVVHAESEDEDEDETLQDIYDDMTEKQKNVVNDMINTAYNLGVEKASSAEHSDLNEDEENEEEAPENNEEEANESAEGSEDDSEDNNTSEDDNEENLNHKEGTDMTGTRNVFEDRENELNHGERRPRLTKDQLSTILEDAKKSTLKESFLAHASEYGITDIDILFPDAKNVTERPELIARRTEWVAGVIDGAKHTPFSRLKSIAADLTAEEARAKGYVKGNLKKDEVIKLLKRVTTPKMIYKKQKLDREDIIDITDLDVVAWLKWEMRFMLEEELARAILIGDGREPDDEDKIDEDHIRPIAWDADMYNTTITLPANTTAEGLVESVIRARKAYKGTGRPAFYTTDDVITDMLLIKDKMGRYVYDTEEALAAKLRVTRLIPVEVMEDEADLLGVMVNIADYTIGADKGGSLTMFEDFDIDYNQEKYLMETRVSGALTKPKSAVTIKRTAGTTVTPQVPAFDNTTDTITIPTQAGVTYYNVTNPLSEVALADGASVGPITEATDIEARADSGYNFPHNTDADWTFAPSA